MAQEHKIDEAEFACGRELFAAGGTLRQLIEPIVFDDGNHDPDREPKEVSRVIGYFDALVERLRQSPHIVHKSEGA